MDAVVIGLLSDQYIWHVHEHAHESKVFTNLLL